MWFPRTCYLDHNATTPLAPQVRRVMTRCLRDTFGNPSSLHTAGRTARGVVDEARAAVATVLGCAPEALVFTSGGTEANNAVIKGVFGAAGKGHLITTRIEHDSVLGACQQVEALGGQVTYLPAGADGLVTAAAVRAALRPDTVLISVMHANNETGALQPVAEIAALARERRIPFHTDAVQTFGKVPVRVAELGCDFLTLNAHKINGPKGVGVLYARGDYAWRPLVFGGDQERQARGGTEGVHQLAGLGVAARLAAEHMDATFRRLQELRPRLLAGIRHLWPEVRFNEAPAAHQLPSTVNATFPGKDGLRLLAGLDCYGVCVSIGSACTADRIEPSHVLLGMGRSRDEALASIRISMGTTTTAGDVAYFLDALERVLAGDPNGFAYLDPQHLTEERLRAPKTFLIDVRFPYERMLLPSLPGAHDWSHLAFERYFKRIPRDREVILICGTGIFSLSAGYRLARHGHPNVKVVYGGYAAWTALHRHK